MTRRIYQNHRDNQRERILEAAEMLFIRDGIDNVSISHIAGAARIARITLYEYFPNKQEIAWAIFQKIVEDGYAYTEDKLLLVEGSGFQRLQHLILAMVEQLQTDAEHLRFIVEFNTLYAREGNPARVRQIVERFSAKNTGLLVQMLHEGILDGSIRADLDPDLISAATLNLINALNSRFALLGDLIQEEYGQSVMEMYREICRAFLRGIQSTPS